MGKTRELDSPAKQGPLSPLRGNGKTLPLTPNAQERVEVSERMGEKREAEMKEMFSKGIPERGNMPEAKSASQKLGEAAKPVEGDHVQGLKQQKPSPSKTPKIVVQGGQVKGKGISAKAQKKSNSKPKGEKEEEKKVAPQSEIVGPDGERGAGGMKPNAMPPADDMQKTANGQEEPAKDEPGEMDPNASTVDGKPKGDGPIDGDPKGDPKQDSKDKREAAKVLDKGQDSKGRGGADTRSGAPGDKGKKADPKGKIKGDKIEGEESPDKKGDQKEGAANADADDAGEDEGEGKDGEKGVNGQDAEPETAPLVRGNFGEGVEPILLQVNQEALKEFGPESIISRNEDGSTIVLAGNFGPTPDEGPSKDGKPRPVRKQVDRSMTTQMYAPNRMKCQSYLDAFETEGRGMVTSLQEARASISGTVATGAESAKNDIQASLVKESAAIKKDFDAKKGALRATAKSQKAAVRATEKSTKAAVEAAADKATQDVQKRYDTNLADLDALEKEFSLRFEHQFVQAPKDLQKACDEVAKDAQALGDRRYNQFVEEGYPEQTTWQDVKWGGDFSKDRYKAKLKATTDSTAAYISSFNNSAKEASDALANAGLPEMLTFVSTSVANSKKELKKVYDKSLAEIAAKKKATIEEVTTSANTSCDAIDGTLKVGLGSLYVKQKQAIEQLEFNAKANTEAIAKTAQEKTTELETQTQAGIDAINEHIDQTITDVSSLNNPDAEQVNAQLMPILAQLQGGFGQGMQLAIEGANGVVGALSTNAKDIVMAFDESKKATIAEGDKIKAGNVFTMGKQAKDFAKKAKELETPAITALKEMGSQGVVDLDAEYTKVYNDVKDKYDKLEKMFVDNTAGFKSNLQSALKGNGTEDCKGLDKEITDNAKKAADAIKPRWKRWAMALVSIVVMIVITAVIVAMLIPPACGILAVLAAGAAMGAAGGMVKYGAAVLIMDEEVSWKKFRHYTIEGAVDGVMIAATMVPGLKVPLVLAMGAGGGMIKYGNDIVNGDGQTKFSAMGLLTAAGAGTIDAAINLAGARYAGKVDDAVKALGGPAMLTFKQQLGVFVKKDVTQAVGATVSGFIQNTQKNFAADRPFDMDSLSPSHLLWELGTNLLQNKVAEKGTHFIVGKTSKSKAYEKSVLDAQSKGQGETVVGAGTDIKSFAEKTLAESQANAEKPVTETKSEPVKADPTPVKVPEGEGAGQKKSPGHEETNNANAGVEQAPTKKKTEVENPAKVESEANARKEAETRAKAEAEAKAKAEADAKAKADAEAKAKQEAETRAKIEAETRAKAEADAKAQKEQASINSKDSESHPNAEPPQDQGGGMKGEGVYKKGEKGDQISELSHKELGDTIIQELGQSGLLPEGASITKKPGEESTLLLTVPDPKNPKNSQQVEVKIDKNFDPSKASSVHGSEQGAAMNTIKVKPDGSLEVTIHLGGEHSRSDIKKMAGHEFSEVVDILGQLSKPKEGATKKEMKKFVEDTKQKIAEQQSAGVFKSDGKADPSAMTAHDRASVQELKQLLKEASMAKPESLPAIQESISKLAESMGLKHGPGVDPKVVADRVNLLEQALGTKLSPQEHANLVTTPEHVAALEKNILAPDVQKVTDPDGTIRYLDKSGQEIGRMKDGVLSYSYKGHGGPIVMDPERPTTIIGKYEDVIHPDTGTKWVHDLPEGSFSRQGGEKGGLNMLDVSQAKFDALLVEAGGDIAKRNELFWQRYNEPLLIKAFQEGHNVRLLSDPNDPRTRTSSYERELSTIEGPDGLAAKYGYIFDPSTQTYKPGPKYDGTPGKNVAPEALPVTKEKPIDDPIVDHQKPKDQGLEGKKIEGPKAEEVKTTPKENPVVETTKETPVVETPKDTPVNNTEGTKGKQEGVKEGVKDPVKETPKAEQEGGELRYPPGWEPGSKNAPPTLEYILKKFAEQGISNSKASEILAALHALPEGSWAVAGGNLNSLLSARAREGNPKYIDMVLDALSNPATVKLGQDLLGRAVNQGEAMGRIGEKLSLIELAALDPKKFDLSKKETVNVLDKILAKADVKSAQEIHSLIDHSGFPEKGETSAKPDIPRLLDILDRAPSDKPLSTAEVLDAIARANKAREEVMAGNFDLPLSTKDMRKTDGLQGDLQSYLHDVLLTSEFGKELAKKLAGGELGKSIAGGKPDFIKFDAITETMRGQFEAFVKQAIAERGLKLSDSEIKAMINTAFGTTRGNFFEAIAHHALESAHPEGNVYGDYKLTVGNVDVHPDNTVIVQDGNNLVIKFYEYKTGNNSESSGQATLRDLINSGNDPMKSLKFGSGLGLQIKKRIEAAKQAGGSVTFEQITMKEKGK